MPDETVRRAHTWYVTEGARARNSQVPELIVDGTLESRLRHRRSNPLGENLSGFGTERAIMRRALFFCLSDRKTVSISFGGAYG